LNPEFFVIMTRDRQYVGPLGIVARIDKALFYPTRWMALRKCNELGAALDGAAIVSYHPSAAAVLGAPVASQGTASAPDQDASIHPSQKPSGRLKTPRKAGNGHIM
jgi:hypothetical protein